MRRRNGSPGNESSRIRDKAYESIFNQYFVCNDAKVIKTLYKKVNKGTVWSHPLILNYNYCLLCMDYSASPHSLAFLQESHMKVNSLYNYFASKGINFKYNESKPLTRRARRLIRSQDSRRTIKVQQGHRCVNQRSMSDTDIYFDLNTNEEVTSLKTNKRPNRVFSLSLKDIKHNDSHINFNEIKTDNVNIKPLESKTSPKETDKRIIDHLDRDYDDESLSLTKYNNGISSSVNNPLYQSLHLEHRVYINDNESKQNSCEICYQALQDKIVLECGDFYCRDCLRTYVLQCLGNISQFNKLHCPKEICKAKLNESEMKQLLANDELVRYAKIKMRVEGLSHPSLIPCPFPDCESYAQRKTLKATKICKCSNNHLYCSKCLEIIKDHNNPEHKCPSHKKKDETMKYLSKNRNIKKCPNCNCYVQRELAKGCNNMTCTNPWCGFQFCWICRKGYDAYHYKNPFSPCFGLSETELESKLARYKVMRIGKCILIFLLLIFIVLPLCLALFSLVAVGLFVLTFVIDGSIIDHIKIKSNCNKKIVNAFMYMFFIFYAVAYIPLGYIAFALGIIFLPVYCFIQRRIQIKKESDS